jgi:hypothetical protein
MKYLQDGRRGFSSPVDNTKLSMEVLGLVHAGPGLLLV